jgi:hypothetical protein
MNMQFRVEMFNAFNHPWFGTPDVNPGDGTKFGTITSMAGDYSPRNIQLAAKFIF